MTELRSRPYQPNPAKCCEACCFGRGEHAQWCAPHDHRKVYRGLGVDTEGYQVIEPPIGTPFTDGWVELDAAKRTITVYLQ